jgi:hypothetical protein
MRTTSLFVVMIILVGMASYAQEPVSAAKGVTYGAGAPKKGGVSVVKMQQIVNEKGAYTGAIKGVVKEVCQEKGCWMRLEAENGETMMVRFLDYGFFMPGNIVGHTVILEGEAKKKEVSVKQQQHYAEDAGKSREEIERITTPKIEIQFIAKGVRVVE